jgi:hypothetical protein
VSTRRAVNFLLVLALVVAALLCLPLAIGVWLPDVFVARSPTIASLRLSDGSEFRVVQYWNHFDFYTTELRHIFPDGPQQTWVLDGDDHKRWRIPLTVDENARTVFVPHQGANLKTIKW